MTAEQIIPHLIQLNEMDLTIVLEALKYHAEEKSTFPNLLNTVLDIEHDDMEVAIADLEDELEEVKGKLSDLKEKVETAKNALND